MTKVDSLATQKEKELRDWILYWPTRLLFKFGIKANYVTILGFIGTFYLIKMIILKEPLIWQIYLIIGIWLTDLIDGPLARNNNNITTFGIYADHIRDMFAALIVIILNFIHQTIPYHFLIFLILINLIIISYNLRKFWLRKRMLEKIDYEVIKNYAFFDLQTSLLGRLNFFFLATSLTFPLGALVFSNPILFVFSEISYILSFVIGGLYLREAWDDYYKEWKKFKKIIKTKRKFKKLLKQENKISTSSESKFDNY